MSVQTRRLPCDGCTACCENENLVLHPECGDDLSKFEHEVIDGIPMLKRHENGDCIYLIRNKGCSIFHRRPASCRELDCRFVAMLPEDVVKKAIEKHVFSEKTLTAAKKMIDRMANKKLRFPGKSRNRKRVGY